MTVEIIDFIIEAEDLAELDRLVEHFGHGNRSRFLREAMRVMAARERAEHLHDVHQPKGRHQRYES